MRKVKHHRNSEYMAREFAHSFQRQTRRENGRDTLGTIGDYHVAGGNILYHVTIDPVRKLHSKKIKGTNKRYMV